MKAFFADRYGIPQQLSDLAQPVISDDQVLVRVHATSVNRGDYYMLRGRPLFIRAMTGLRRPEPIIPGSDLAGVIEATGKNVTQFKPATGVRGALRRLSRIHGRTRDRIRAEA